MRLGAVGVCFPVHGDDIADSIIGVYLFVSPDDNSPACQSRNEINLSRIGKKADAIAETNHNIIHLYDNVYYYTNALQGLGQPSFEFEDRHNT
jgi:hypothetical protein